MKATGATKIMKQSKVQTNSLIGGDNFALTELFNLIQ
jgi:hypothetical protein